MDTTFTVSEFNLSDGTKRYMFKIEQGLVDMVLSTKREDIEKLVDKLEECLVKDEHPMWHETEIDYDHCNTCAESFKGEVEM